MLHKSLTYLSGSQWNALEPLFPSPSPHPGRPAVHPRRVLEAVLFHYILMVPYAELPASYPPPTTVATRFSRWKHTGLWNEIRATIYREFANRTGA